MSKLRAAVPFTGELMAVRAPNLALARVPFAKSCVTPVLKRVARLPVRVWSSSSCRVVLSVRAPFQVAPRSAVVNRSPVRSYSVLLVALRVPPASGVEPVRSRRSRSRAAQVLVARREVQERATDSEEHGVGLMRAEKVTLCSFLGALSRVSV